MVSYKHEDLKKPNDEELNPTLAHGDYRVLNKNKRQKFRVAPRSSRLANDGKDGAILLSLRGSKIRFGNLRFEE
jgi:hypothetical protein